MINTPLIVTIRTIFSRTGLIVALVLAILLTNFGLPLGLFHGRVGWKQIASERQSVIDDRTAALYTAATALNVAKGHLLSASEIIKAVVVRSNATTAALKAESDRRTAEALAAQQAADQARQRWDAMADNERRLAVSVPINLSPEQRIVALEASNRTFMRDAGL